MKTVQQVVGFRSCSMGVIAALSKFLIVKTDFYLFKVFITLLSGREAIASVKMRIALICEHEIKWGWISVADFQLFNFRKTFLRN